MYILYRVKLYCINININLIIVNIYENAFELNVSSYQVRLRHINWKAKSIFTLTFDFNIWYNLPCNLFVIYVISTFESQFQKHDAIHQR